MNEPATARSYFSILRVLTRISLAIAVLATSFFLYTAEVNAQAAQYGNYVDLFNNGPLPSKLNLLKKFDPVIGSTTAAPLNLQFQFISSFDLSVGGDSPKKWHWDHIRDFDEDDHIFVLRVCDIGVPNDGACYFSIVPHESQMATDAAEFCPNGLGSCTFPNQSTQSVKKIYHYTIVQNNNSFPESIQNDKFNVLFNVKEMATLGNSTLNSLASLNTIMHFGDQKTYRADVWYCATTYGSETLPSNEPNANIRQFNGLCGSGHPYFKIAESDTFKMPNSAAEALAEAAAPPEQVDTSPQRGDGLPECSMTNGTLGSGSFMGCIARLVYYVIYWPVAWFAGLLGVLFDFFIGYSLSDTSYRAEFAVRGWQIVRDISNIFFIIILVWTGLSTVFGVAKKSMKQVVPMLILNAILINFSLFATRVVIDISNVVARVFYNSIHVCQGTCNKEDGKITNFLTGPGGYKSLSTKIVSSFNPQKMFSTGVLDQAKSVKGIDTTRAAASDNQIAGYFIVVSIIAAAILFGIAMMFWKTAFFFLGRVIGLYVAMIFAPFAFLSNGNMPIVSNIKELSWDSWLNDLTKYALLAPIFVFFLYIIYSLINSDFIKVFKTDITSSFFETVIFIAIPMLIVYFMMKQGVDIAKKYAGTIGQGVQNFAQKATGIVGGAALGVGAIVGGRIIGGAASALNKSKAGEWLRDKGKSTGLGGWLARRSVSTMNATEKSSFDLRKTKLGQNLFREMGVDTDHKALGALSGIGLGIGTANTAGGFQGQVDRAQKKREEESKLLESKQNQSEIDAYNEKNKKRYQSNVDGVIETEMNKRHGKAVVDDWKENNKPQYEAERQKVLMDPGIQSTIDSIKKPVEKKSVQEMNAARKETFADNLKKGTIVDQILGEDSVVGAIFGANVRMAADKKAAKKISESAKIEKDLTEINNTLKGGFREIVAMDKMRDHPLWQNLTAAERTSLMKGEKIKFINSTGKQVEGGFYDYIKDKDSAAAKAIDIDVTSAENDKDKKKDILDQIKTRQQFKFDFKTLNKDIKDAESDYANSPTQTNLDALNKLKAERVRLKNEQKKWQDLDRYIEEQKKKLEGKE